MLVILLFTAIATALRWTEDSLLGRPSPVLVLCILAVPAALWIQGRKFCDHSDYVAAERYGREVLNLLPPDAMILTRGDYDIYPLWYQQIVEGYRRDVVVFGSNFLAAPGYARHFEGRYDPPVAARFFEQTPQEEVWLKTMANVVIGQNMDRRPIYATWADPRLGYETERMEISVFDDEDAVNVPEAQYFPEPAIYRLYKSGVTP
jgi:hypothetical protein